MLSVVHQIKTGRSEKEEARIRSTLYLINALLCGVPTFRGQLHAWQKDLAQSHTRSGCIIKRGKTKNSLSYPEANALFLNRLINSAGSP
jgi:hypothetical protein